MVATTKVATTGMLQVHPLTVRAVEVLHVQLTSDTHLIVTTSLGLIVYLSACLKLRRRPIVDQQCN